MKSNMNTILKRSYLWIILFGSLIGLNETLIGSINMPYRSVVLSAITLTILSFARSYFPKAGTSIIIMLIAVLFKVNTVGFNACSSTFFLCGPTALILLGIGFEIFSFIFLTQKTFKYSSYLYTCVFTSIFAFSLFAIMNTFILKSWDTSRLVQYIFIKGFLTAIVSSAITILSLFIAKSYKNDKLLRINPYVINGILGLLIISLWVFGTIS